MNDFKNAYQSAVQDMEVLGMKEIHIDASACMDKSKHRKRRMKHVQRVTTTAFSVVCVVFICSIGTVKAAEYLGNVIKVNQLGFRSGDAATMARSEEEVNQLFIVDEKIAEPSEQAAGTQAAGTEESTEELMEVLPEEKLYLSKEKSGAEPEAASAEPKAASAEEIPVKNYQSWEEFESAEDIVFPQPSAALGNGSVTEDITVCGDWAMIRYDTDGKVLWMERTDYSGTQGHASSKVFPGGVCNERSYTTPAGYIYTLVDSVAESKEEQQIHAAVSVGNYEVFIDFMGYGEKEAKKIMDSIDLSLYE